MMYGEGSNTVALWDATTETGPRAGNAVRGLSERSPGSLTLARMPHMAGLGSIIAFASGMWQLAKLLHQSAAISNSWHPDI